MLDKDTVARGEHLVGKIYFANYQNLDEEFQGKKLYEHFTPDFFDVVVVDECHRSAFGDWFGVLEHFGNAFQLGLTATPREIDQSGRALTEEEIRRDTFVYFTGNPEGEPAYTYSLKQAIDDGFLVPYLLEERISNVDDEGYTGPDGRHYTTKNFERDIRLPERTRLIAEDLWQTLGKYQLTDEKSIIFCVDDTHAAFMAAELRRLSGDQDYAARITRSERNSHQLERNFAEVGRAKPRVAVTVDLLTTGFDAPDVKNIVFARPLLSSILYKQMKGRGTRLCDDIDKRYFTIFDYVGASQLEDSEFDGHPANVQKPKSSSKRKTKTGEPAEKPVGDGIKVFIAHETNATSASPTAGKSISTSTVSSRRRSFAALASREASPTCSRSGLTRRHAVTCARSSKTATSTLLPSVISLGSTRPMTSTSSQRLDLTWCGFRAAMTAWTRFWDQDDAWLLARIREQALATDKRVKARFWQTSLDHYALYGIDDLEQGSTYSAPQFTNQFGGFSSLLQRYGGPTTLKDDLEAVKQHLYIPMAA